MQTYNTSGQEAPQSLPSFTLSNDQRRILDSYQQMQDRTLRQIDLLYATLDRHRMDLGTMLFLFYGFTPAYTFPPPGSQGPWVQWMRNTNPPPNFTLEADQQVFLNLFHQRHESTLTQIDLLYDNLERLRADMTTLMFTYYGFPPSPLYTQTAPSPVVTFPSSSTAPGAFSTQEYTGVAETAEDAPQHRVDAPAPSSSSSTPSTPASLPPLLLFETTLTTGTDATLPAWLTNFLQSTSRMDGVNVTNTGGLEELLQQFYQPVVVAPTAEQVTEATRRVRFQDIEQPVNLVCPISLDIFRPDQEVTQLIHCGHIFDTTQIQQWFTSHVHCPMCRHDIRHATGTDTASAPRSRIRIPTRMTSRLDASSLYRGL